MTLNDEQQSARLRGIGSSEIGAVVGLSPWATPLDVYRRKVGEAPPPPPTARMVAGSRLEGALLAWGADEYGWRAHRCSSTLRAPSRPWCVASPDGFLVDERRRRTAVVEVKTAEDGVGWGEPGTNVIPPVYRAQVEWQMMVTRLSEAAVVVFFLDRAVLCVYRVVRSEELSGALLDAGRRFWLEHVRPRRPPLLPSFGRPDLIEFLTRTPMTGSPRSDDAQPPRARCSPGETT